MSYYVEIKHKAEKAMNHTKKALYHIKKAVEAGEEMCEDFDADFREDDDADFRDDEPRTANRRTRYREDRKPMYDDYGYPIKPRYRRDDY